MSLPVMVEEEFSQAEVWDDSALMDSWNEAFEEYKKYHSLAAKGEKVKLEVQPSVQAPLNGDGPTATNTELEAEPETDEHAVSHDQAKAGAEAIVAAPPPLSGALAMPQTLLGSAQNEELKNLMMSWYYAGYYTGLYEGKQQGYETAMQQREG